MSTAGSAGGNVGGNSGGNTAGDAHAAPWGPGQWAATVLLWLWVVVPFTYGLVQLVVRIPALFSG